MQISSAAALALLAALAVPARGDDFFRPVIIGKEMVYLVPQDYAEEHRAELIASIPGPPKVQSFWTPSETDVLVAERVFRELVEDAAKDPGRLFPELEGQKDANSLELIVQARTELGLVMQHYPVYQKQYVGLVIDGTKLVYCNYAVAPGSDASSDYIYIQKVFADDGSTHFLQAEVDPYAKTCSHVSYIGSWQAR